MKRKIKNILCLVLLLGIFSCSGKEQYKEPNKLYLFETSDYTDFDDSCRVIYVKSHRQLIERGEFFLKHRPDVYQKVYNAFGHEVSTDFMNPRITINTSDPSYDITIHMHSPGDNVVIINSDVNLEGLDLKRYYMREILVVDSIRSVFKFINPLSIVDSVETDRNIYTIHLKNHRNIDFSGGERVVLEYSDYKIPIPYQIFK